MGETLLEKTTTSPIISTKRHPEGGCSVWLFDLAVSHFW